MNGVHESGDHTQLCETLTIKAVLLDMLALIDSVGTAPAWYYRGHS